MNVHIILVPYDSGAENVRMGRGPKAIVGAGLADRLRHEGHSVSLVHIRAPDRSLQAEIATSFALQREVATAVGAAKREGALPIVLSGNCNSSVGTVSGLHSSGLDPAVLWFDAHADFNTPESSPSGFLDGMAVSMLLGDCWTAMTSQQEGFTPLPADQVMLLGTRSVDAPEAARLGERHLQSMSPGQIAARQHVNSLTALSAKRRDAYLHVDLDVLDPAEGRANGFAVEGGLSLAELGQVVRELCAEFDVQAMALTAYDPSSDPEGRVARAAIELASLVVGISRPDESTRRTA
jgi:arginase